MAEIKAIVFDMDGVLIDAKGWHYQALNRALEMFGYQISRYDHLVTFDGLPTRKKLQMLTMEEGLPKNLHPLINDLKQIYTLEMIHAQCKPRFQHEYALSRLRADGYKLGVASNSVRQTIEIMMEKSNLKRYLHFMLSNQDVARSKPDPEIYQKAASLAGCLPEECLVVEDNEHGVMSGKAAGAPVMVVEDVFAVNYESIKNFIQQYEGQ